MRERLPTCKNYYNIYHPQDIIAYRIEPLFQVKEGEKGIIQQNAVLLPYYKNNGYRTYAQFNNLFKQNPASVMASSIAFFSDIKKQYVV